MNRTVEDLNRQLHAIVEAMSVEEKIGQLFLLAFSGHHGDKVRDLIQRYGIGGCYLSQDNAATPREAAELAGTLQEYAAASAHRIPLLLGVDQEGIWGAMVPYSTTGPGNLALGAAGDPAMTCQMYEVLGREMGAVGWNTLFAPCVDINANPGNPIIGMRSFGEFPACVVQHTRAAVEGALSTGIITTVKHFPGHGDTAVDSHRQLPTVNKKKSELESVEFLPFREAVRAGVDCVMTSHILFPEIDSAEPATFSRILLRDILRTDMGFQGVILTDSMNMGSVKKNYDPGEAVVKAISAGVNLIMLAEEHYDHDPGRFFDQQVGLIQSVFRAVETGLIPMEAIDRSVESIVALKLRKGLFNRDLSDLHPELIGRPEHRQVALEAARRAVTVLRDRNGLWPVPPEKPLICVQAAPRATYRILTETRGIGPNQAVPAFDSFRERLSACLPETVFLNHAQALAGPDITATHRVVVVTEDYPLPGVDFETEPQTRLVGRLQEQYGNRMVIVALRSPYELAHFPKVSTYACAFSSRHCAAEAAAEALAGIIPAGGSSPVSVPV